MATTKPILVAGKVGQWPQFGVECNDENLVTISGLNQQENLEFDDRVSETGVMEQPRQIVRATEGNDVTNELLDWDGKRWGPVPADWENDRARFNDAFVPNYIREWEETVPSGPAVTLSIKNDCFKSGAAVVDNDVLIPPLSQPDIIQNPTTADSDRVTKPPTSDAAIANAINKAKSTKTNKKLAQALSKQYQQEIELYVPEANPFTPAMDIYIRPAEERDADAIAWVYNRSIEASNIPEDQTPITVESVRWLIGEAKGRTPFIVAVAGSCPQGPTQVAEYVLGFARTEAFDYGMSGNMSGRSRGTASLQIFVEPQFQRKRIGYSLMDRMLHMISPSYAYMEAAKWANPTQSIQDEVPGGFGLWHQLLFKVACHKEEDDEFRGVKNFLFGKFFFKETARLPSTARSKPSDGKARFMDMAFFQREASAAAEFEPYM